MCLGSKRKAIASISGRPAYDESENKYISKAKLNVLSVIWVWEKLVFFFCKELLKSISALLTPSLFPKIIVDFLQICS